MSREELKRVFKEDIADILSSGYFDINKVSALEEYPDIVKREIISNLSKKYPNKLETEQ